MRQRSAADANIVAEQVRVLYEQAITASIISLLVAGLVCLILRDLTSGTVLATWFAALAAIAIFRFILVRRFHRRPPAAAAMERWERSFVASLVATGLVWGVGGLVSVASRDAVVASLDMLMARADGALYEAKEGGRNRVAARMQTEREDA